MLDEETPGEFEVWAGATSNRFLFLVIALLLVSIPASGFPALLIWVNSAIVAAIVLGLGLVIVRDELHDRRVTKTGKRNGYN